MENEPLFLEKQYFRQWWIWLLLIGINSVALYGAFTQVVMGHVFGDNPMSDLGLIIFAIAFTLFAVFFLSQYMTTKIDEQGVYVKFWPYHKKWRLYTWEQIAGCELKKYNPVFDYGGWGIRQGVYNLYGNMGLKLTFKSGKPSLMIGTQKTEEMRTVLEKLNKLKSNE